MNEYFSQEYFQTNEESIKKHIRFLKDNYRNELIKLGLSKKVIEQFLAENFTPKEYIHTQKRIFYEECKSDIYISQYATLNAISDILDAVFLGKLNSKKVKNMYGETILYATGHGIAYYSSNMHGFDEMLANFSIIVKSPNASASLNYLRSLIGDELFDTLSDFYYNNILEEKEVSHSLGGR